VTNGENQPFESTHADSYMPGAAESMTINAIKGADYWTEPLEPNESWRDSYLYLGRGKR